jgi:hypothetical protein
LTKQTIAFVITRNERTRIKRTTDLVNKPLEVVPNMIEIDVGDNLTTANYDTTTFARVIITKQYSPSFAEAGLLTSVSLLIQSKHALLIRSKRNSYLFNSFNVLDWATCFGLVFSKRKVSESEESL